MLKFLFVFDLLVSREPEASDMLSTKEPVV
jgi:hypothetical protein